MCGAPGVAKRIPPQREVDYLDGLVRGVYARRQLAVGEVLSDDDIYLAVPLLKGQISCRELIAGEELVAPIAVDAPVMVQAIGGPYGRNPSLRARIEARGLEV